MTMHYLKNSSSEGVYAPTNDTTLEDLKLFQKFLFRNFKKSENYEKMLPVSNQPERLHGTAKSIRYD